MRIILLMTSLLSVIVLKSQTVMPTGFANYAGKRVANNNIRVDDSLSKKQWSFNTYSGISTGFIFFKGGSATIISVPIGLQLNRRLNNNLYAFANISVAPAYSNFNHSFLIARSNKFNPGNIFSGSSNMGVYSGASLGLMYINNDKTFSISGSIGLERSSNSLLPLYPANISGPNPYAASRR